MGKIRNANVLKVDGVATGIETLIPIEERAINGVVAAGSGALTQEMVPVLETSETAIKALIPEDEQSVSEPDNEVDIYTEAMRQGYVSPTNGMARIGNVPLPGQLYVSVQNNSKGNRTVVFRQQYNDGRLSPQICVEQSDLLMYDQFSRSKEKSLQTKAKKILTKVSEEYWGKFDGDVILDTAELMQILVRAAAQLRSPKSIDVLENPSVLYSQIVAFIKGYNLPYSIWVDRTAYYGLTEEQMDGLAQHFGVKRLPFLRKLNEYGLLYLTESSKGYQTKVRVPGDGDISSSVEWLYCIYKLEYFTQKNQLEKPKNP